MGPQGPLVYFLSVDLPVLDGPRERGWNSVASWVCSSCWAPWCQMSEPCTSLGPRGALQCRWMDHVLFTPSPTDGHVGLSTPWLLGTMLL